ncbi:hypothetical protein [Halomonas eurihalina]|uniref:hypothetical protein n=1 Tax=Halomonas eurihalina TaxID=42566 RepID=UPI0016592F0A|nr:hypothetical protein [Halomonas eurihalina]MDR5859035.1 hypothetical protein [Halomonas eurihalina]
METRIQGWHGRQQRANREAWTSGDFISKVIHGIKLRAFLQSPILLVPKVSSW